MQDPEGRLIKSEPRLWLTDFQIDKETGLGKTDLKFRLPLTLPNGVDTRTHEWLMGDLFLELYHTRPQIRETKQEEGDTVKNEAIIIDGIPQSETSLLGVSTNPFGVSDRNSMCVDNENRHVQAPCQGRAQVRGLQLAHDEVLLLAGRGGQFA